MNKINKILSESTKTTKDDFFQDSNLATINNLFSTFKLMSIKSKVFVSLLILGSLSCAYFSMTNTIEIISNYSLVRTIEKSIANEQKELSKKEEDKNEPEPPSDWVEIPNTSFKSKEEVTLLFEKAG